MLTPEQLKDYREQFSKYFAEKSQKADKQGILGALLTALGIERSRLVPDSVRRLNFEKADALKNWSGKIPDASQFKPFDIMLRTGSGTGELEPSNFNWRQVTGEKEAPGSRLGRQLYEMAAGKRDNHAYILLPYETKDGTKLVPTVINNYTTKGHLPIVAANPRSKAFIDAAKRMLGSRKPLLDRIRGFAGNYNRRFNALEEQAKRVSSTPTPSWSSLIEQNAAGSKPESVIDFLKGDARKDLGEQATYRFMRFKDELSPAEMEQVKKRLMPVLSRTFTSEDNMISGAKNFLFGPGKSKSTFNPNQRIPTCSGGACYAFEGLRDMPSVSRALPQDLAKHPSLREVGNFFPGKVSPSNEGIRQVWGNSKRTYTVPTLMQSQKTVSNNSIRAARRALQARFGMAALPLAAGGYMLGSSPTAQNLLNPLAEQGKRITQGVKDYITKAKA